MKAKQQQQLLLRSTENGEQNEQEMFYKMFKMMNYDYVTLSDSNNNINNIPKQSFLGVCN